MPDPGFLRNVYLQFSLVFLLLLSRLFAFPKAFSDAIAVSLSLPVAYALAMLARERRFVKPRSPDVIVEDVLYEAMAILAAYIIGLVTFIAMTGLVDLLSFTAGFTAVLTLRFLTSYTISYLEMRGVDPSSPLVVILFSFANAVLVFTIIYAIIAAYTVS